MLDAAENRAGGRDLLRIEPYEKDRQPLFGEFYLYLGSDLDRFDPPGMDLWLGAQ